MTDTRTVPLHHLTTREIRPLGWLKRQLRIQADGLCGHLDQVWPDIRDSAWIGGSRDGWERVPYWLDGFIPLAYLLDDADLKARAQRYIDAILNGQREDGWICPCGDEERPRYDVWAVFLICKVLMVYGECTGDLRARDAVSRALKQLQQHLKTHTLFNWGQSRWFEGLVPLWWLYDQTKEDWLLDLAVTLRTQGLDYEALFACWRDQQPRRSWSHQTHIVNLAMALKSAALFSPLSGDDPDAFAEAMFDQLTACHGSAVGHILGDECLAGQSPIHGTELCSISEAMYSCEVLFERTVNPLWMDRAETLAFNSLPATISDDMWTHQYLQLENQIACARQEEPPIFYTNGPESTEFGLEPNYGCCTANFNQAWPKLALSAFLASEDKIASAALVPSEVTVTLHGAPVTVRLETEYPFRNALQYTVICEKPVEFTLSLRIPGFAESAKVDGEPVQPGTIHDIRRVWQGEQRVTVTLDFKPVFQSRPEGMSCLRRGPLVFAVPIAENRERLEYERNGVERRFPYCDYSLTPASEWGWAFAGDDLRLIENPVGDYPFSRTHPPVQLAAPMARIPWSTLAGQPTVCAETPDSLTPISRETLLLQPYGCTNLRMTVMPKIDA